jgi:hypothetical protein
VSAAICARVRLTDAELDAMGEPGEVWRAMGAANAATRPPQRARGHTLTVSVLAPYPEVERAHAAAAFWRDLGDLVADILLDASPGPWSTSEPDGSIAA